MPSMGVFDARVMGPKAANNGHCSPMAPLEFILPRNDFSSALQLHEFEFTAQFMPYSSVWICLLNELEFYRVLRGL